MKSQGKVKEFGYGYWVSTLGLSVSCYFQICPSYPHAVLVPKVISDEMLLKIASFRQHGRFPVLSYYHRDSRVSWVPAQ